MMLNQRTILVVGSANIDLVTRVPRCPKPGESLIGRSFATITGGKGANQAVAAARLGARTVFAGCVGADAFGELQRASLSAAGVDVSHLKTHPSEPTGTAVILVGDEGQNSIVVTPSANYGLRPEDLDPLEAVFRAADAVLLQLEIPIETVEAALDMARRCGVLSILDAGPAQRVPERIVAKADIVSPNETEAEAMTGQPCRSLDDARLAASLLLAMGAPHVVLKLGANGSLYVSEGACYAAAPFSIEAVDTTAAGDAFTAALAVAWDAGDIPGTLRFANAAGALAATKPGAQPSMPTRAAVEQFLKNERREM
jgi:ribokinase